MRQAAKNANKFAFSAVLKACAHNGSLQQGRVTHDQVIRSGKDAHAIVSTAIVDMYAKCGSFEEACKTFDICPHRDLVSWNAIISACIDHGSALLALDFFTKMQLPGGFSPNKVSFMLAVKACGVEAIIWHGRLIHDHIVRSGIVIDEVCGSSLIDMYAKCGDMDDACTLFKTLPYKNVFSWGALMAGYVQHGLGFDALDLFEKMQQHGGIPQGGNTLGGTELRKRCLFLRGLLLQLAQCSSHCSFAVVDRLSGMVEAHLTKLQQLEDGQEPAISVMAETRDQDLGNLYAVSIARSYFLRMVCCCVRDCGLIWLSEEGHLSKILFRLTKLVTFIMTTVVSHHILKDLLLLLLKARGFLSSQQAQAIAIKVNDAVVSFVKEEDYWSAYKVMTLAACHGLWNISSEAIEHIVQKARSGSTYFWLKALAAICTFEGILQGECESWNHTNTVASQRCYESLVDMETNEVTHSSMSGNLGKAIARALSGVYLAENSLAAAVKLERTFEFQRRLLSLRITFVRTSGELLGLLRPICVDFKSSDVEAVSSLIAPIDDDVKKSSSSSIQAVAIKSGLFCRKFKKLAVAFDVLRVSCMGIDEESTNILSFSSLGCSFISFCILCSLSIPQVLGSGSALNPSMQCLAASVSNDLYQRLDMVGEDEWSDLLTYILQLGGANESSIIGGGFCVYKLEKEAYKFISWAVREVLGIQEDRNLRNPELSWLVLARGMHVCKKVVEKWLCLPWALPKHFLCTRPPVSMDVFVELMIDSQTGKEKRIAQGLLAPLSICFQIRNLDINGGKKVKRLCSAVMLKSDKTETGELCTGCNLGWCNEMTMCSDRELFLLEKLFKEVSFSKEMMWEELNQHGKHRQVGRDSPPIVSCGVNEKGQGFASCLLDTSGLKCGVYHVSVLAVCLDKEHRCWIVPPLGDGPTVRVIPSTSG